jgi:hypothetical protein
MKKLYVVRLTDEERETLNVCVNKLKGSSQKVKRAQILLKADADGPNWTDVKIADAFNCRTKTVENVRRAALGTARRANSPAPHEGGLGSRDEKNCGLRGSRTRSKCEWFATI